MSYHSNMGDLPAWAKDNPFVTNVKRPTDTAQRCVSCDKKVEPEVDQDVVQSRFQATLCAKHYREAKDGGRLLDDIEAKRQAKADQAAWEEAKAAEEAASFEAEKQRIKESGVFFDE